MLAYASRTGTKRNLALLRQYGWRLMVSPAGVLRTEGFAYGLDNGAWTVYQQGGAFSKQAFLHALDRLGSKADFVVLPDIVCGGMGSFDLSCRWMDRVLDAAPYALFAVQNGFTVEMVEEVLSSRVGIFVGGNTEWKEATMAQWGALGQKVGCSVHVGRVNSARRIHQCALARCTSFDGSSASRYALSIPGLEYARRQLTLPLVTP